MEVKIDGTVIELGNSIPAITKKSIDINDLSKRFLEITNRFDLPDTNPNRVTFDSPQGIGTNNRSFEKKYNMSITDNTVLFRGNGMLSKTSNGVVGLQGVNSSKDVFKVLDKKLNELTYDDVDTELTTTAIDALDSFDIDNVWYWGKACYHQTALKVNTDQTTGDPRCLYSRPAFNISAFLKRIVVSAGYGLTPPAVSLALSSNHSDFFFTSYQKTLSGATVASGTTNLTGLDTNDFEQDVTTASTTIAIGTNKTKFRIRGTIASTANITLIVRATDDVDGTKISESQILLTGNTSEIDFTTSEFYSASGMTVEVILSGTGTVTFSDTLLYTLISEKTAADLSSNPFLDYKIKVHDNLPDLTFTDLFKTVCVIGNQQQDIDTFNKSFTFRSMANLSKLNAVNWSEKFIEKTDTVTAEFENLYQRNYLRYTNDVTVPVNLGEALFLCDNENLIEDGEYIKLPFSASIDVVINSNTIAQVPVYNDTARITTPEPSMRLFAITSDKLQFAPISWAEIKENYYAEFFNSLYRVRVIECELNLSKLDFLSWTPRQLATIDYFNSTFIVLELNNFISGRPTSAKLLKYGG